MTTRQRLTDADYAAMADDYAANPLRADETAGPVEINPDHPDVNVTVLRTGRPAGGGSPRGRTPTTSVRLPADIKTRLDARAADEAVKPAEIIRRALVEYLDRHPA
ncbi:MAG: CopG family transcriptional regulator [Gordonia sp. (in: high G+C Gram-positive bacteria)]